jgi:hypothetical protein
MLDLALPYHHDHHHNIKNIGATLYTKTLTTLVVDYNFNCVACVLHGLSNRSSTFCNHKALE